MDFSCYNTSDAKASILAFSDQQVKKLRYIYISTDSTYDASGYLLKYSEPPFQVRSEVYKNAYSQFKDCGIPEECAIFV